MEPMKRQVSRRNFLELGLAGAAGLLLAQGAQAAEFSRTLDIYQGFNFKPDKQTPVGYLISLSIGGVKLQPDLNVMNPVNRTKAQVAAVMRSYQWRTGLTDAMYFGFNVSTQNTNAIRTLLLGQMRDSSVAFSFLIFQYDPARKQFFRSMGSKGDVALSGLIELSNKEFNLAIANDPSHEVQLPQNFAATIGIKPAPGKSMSIEMAAAVGTNVTKKWGA